MSKQEYAPQFRLGPIKLPAGEAVFPHLLVPDTKFKKEGEYRTGIRYDEKTVAPIREQLNKFLDEAVEKYREWLEDNGKKAKAKTLGRADPPIKADTDEEGDETGTFVVNAKRKASGKRKNGQRWKARLTFADSKGRVIPVKNISDIWGGSELAIYGEVKTYYFAKDNEAGVSIEINGVQIKKLISGGERKVEFDEMEGDDGFSADELDTDTSDDDSYDDEDSDADDSSDDDSSDDDDF